MDKTTLLSEVLIQKNSACSKNRQHKKHHETVARHFYRRMKEPRAYKSAVDHRLDGDFDSLMVTT